MERPSASPTKFVWGRAWKRHRPVSMNPTPCSMFTSPSRFFNWPSKIRTEPPVTKPLIKDCDRKRTKYAALQRPRTMSHNPDIRANNDASCVRSSRSWKYCSWSAIRMAAIAPDEIEACGDVPSIAYTNGGTKAQ